MNTSVYEDKCIGAFLGTAIGDALGWPNEMRSQIETRYTANSSGFIKWSRSQGGRFGNHSETIFPGEYSDDTQLTLAIARCLLKGAKWNVYFIRNELPYWLQYERGGGSAVKKAAKYWAKHEKEPWTQNDKSAVLDYFNAGGNGAAMRILPHVVANLDGDIENVMKDVLRDSMYTHGHPRALIGATCYAYALWYLAHKEETLAYGELVEAVLMNCDIWGSLRIVSQEWINIASENINRDYYDLWDECLKCTIENLHIIKERLNKGLLDVGRDAIDRIGGLKKSINGAGDIAAVSAIYFASKYASNPSQGIKEAAFMTGIDTDTIASMVGGLLGILLGSKWIPVEWRNVQDSDYLCHIATSLINANGSERQEGNNSSRPTK